jgi:hypothetical protein
LANKLGEDGLIDLALEAMVQNNAGRLRSKKSGRYGGLIVGFFMGIFVGSIFLGVGWLLDTFLRVPFGYSLAAMTNGAVITIPTSIVLVALRKKEEESIDFRTVSLYYTLASIVGGLIGVGRWLLDIDTSIMDTFIDPLWEMFNSVCLLPAILVGTVIAIGIWVISLGQSSCGIYDVTGVPIFYVFMILLIVSFFALLADAPLWKGILPLLNQNVVGVTLSVTVGLGGLLGLCWPPVLQDNA